MNKILRFTLGLVALCLSSALYAAETAIDFTAQTITKTDNGFTLTVDPFTFTALKNNGATAPTPQFRNPTNSLRSLRSKPPRMRFLLFKLAFCHILTDMSA